MKIGIQKAFNLKIVINAAIVISVMGDNLLFLFMSYLYIL